MMKIFKRSKVLNSITGILTVATLVLVIICIDNVKSKTVLAIKSSAFTIIPSLFSVCVLCGVITKSGIIERIVIVKGIDSKLLTAFLLGNIGGYPIGAKLLCDMVNSGEISKETAEKAVCFSFASGPAFVFGIVNSLVTKSLSLSLIIFMSVFAANLTMYIIYCCKNKYNSKQRHEHTAVTTGLIVECVRSASYSMISIGASIVFFSSVIAVIEKLMPFTERIPAISAFLEISNVTEIQCNGLYQFLLICLLMAFGGICVHMQIISIVGSAFSLKSFYKSRPLQLFLTAAYALAMCLAFKIDITADVTNVKYVLSESNSVIPLLCTLGMIFISFTYTHPKTNKKIRTRL